MDDFAVFSQCNDGFDCFGKANKNYYLHWIKTDVFKENFYKQKITKIFDFGPNICSNPI